MNQKNKKLNFVYGSKSKEFWFIENKFNEAKKSIGEERFAYIINQNILNSFDKDKNIFFNNLKGYIESNYKKILPEIKEKGEILEKRWKKFEKDFFLQMEKITGVKWKYNDYQCFLLYACFWGGDYDINKPNIYINPLLKHGDPLYIIFHELSHLIYWEYIYSKYPEKFILKNNDFLWSLSEIMVNYPLPKLKIDFNFSIIVPEKLSEFSKDIIDQFPSINFIDLINEEINKKRAE